MEGYESKIAFHPSTHFLKKKTTFLSSISRLFIHGFRRHWKVRFFHRHSEGGSDLGSSSSQSFRDSSPFDETLTLGIQPVGIQPLRASPFEFAWELRREISVSLFLSDFLFRTMEK